MAHIPNKLAWRGIACTTDHRFAVHVYQINYKERDKMCQKCKPRTVTNEYQTRHYKICRFCGWDQWGWRDGGKSCWDINGKTEWRRDRIYERQPDFCQCHPCYGCRHVVFLDSNTVYVCHSCGTDDRRNAYFLDKLGIDRGSKDKYLCLRCFRSKMTHWIESIAPKPQPAQLQKVATNG